MEQFRQLYSFFVVIPCFSVQNAPILQRLLSTCHELSPYVFLFHPQPIG